MPRNNALAMAVSHMDSSSSSDSRNPNANGTNNDIMYNHPPRTGDELAYELTVSPRASVYSRASEWKSSHSRASLDVEARGGDFKSTHPHSHGADENEGDFDQVELQDQDPSSSAPTQTQAENAGKTSKPITPSIRLLFSLLPRKYGILLLTPAIILSLLSGGIAPFMTLVIGKAFYAFAQFPLTPNPPQEAKDALLRGVGMAAVQLVGLAVGSLVLSSATSWLWIWTGERNAREVREWIFKRVMKKEMAWFDDKMGNEDGGNGAVGAGGFMTKFTRETDDIRMASSLASGLLVQYLTTCITCLLLAFTQSWSLTLVILSAVPLLTFIQALSQVLATPLLSLERSSATSASSHLTSTLSSIPTVKAYSAHPYHNHVLSLSYAKIKDASIRLTRVWMLTSGLAQFVMMGMFVQGFWFGSKMVRGGKLDAGKVMSVFWACLIASSNLQMCIGQMMTMEKGKSAMVELQKFVDDAQDDEALPSPSSTVVAPGPPIKKIRPARCQGEFLISNLTFAYPSRPHQPVLKNVSMYLPANEMTFIVGSSGSGKSTVAGLLVGLYKPSAHAPGGRGEILLDEQSLAFLDPSWVRTNVSVVSQHTVIFEGSIYDNIVMGALDPAKVAREEVMHVARLALVNEFVNDLEEGWETLLSPSGVGGEAEEKDGEGKPMNAGGVQLSGGQKQRLAIARALIRDASVLILDEATSALDPTTRILVFEAIRAHRRNKTTIVITHDLSQIGEMDFVYVLKEGDCVERGFRCDLESAPSSPGGAEAGEERGVFREMLEVQMKLGGCLPEKDPSASSAPRFADLLEEDDEDADSRSDSDNDNQDQQENRYLKARASTFIRPISLGNWMFDVVAELVGGGSRSQVQPATAEATIEDKDLYRVAKFPYGRSSASSSGSSSGDLYDDEKKAPLSPGSPRLRRPSSLHIDTLLMPSAPQTARTQRERLERLSLQFVPKSPSNGPPPRYTRRNMMPSLSQEMGLIEDEREFEEGDKKVMKTNGDVAMHTRRSRAATLTGRYQAQSPTPTTAKVPLIQVTVESPLDKPSPSSTDASPAPPTLFNTVRLILPQVPNKPLLILGLVCALLSGSITPVFSYLLSRLMFEVSIGAQNTPVINTYGGIVLAVAAVDGLLLALKFGLLEICSVGWLSAARTRATARLLAQDKTFFDRPANSPSRLVQILVKDGYDARNLIATVVGQTLVVGAMVCVGLGWALVRGWELTLVGLGIAPVFAGVMALQAGLVANCEKRNKEAREEVGRGYYETIANIRSIRYMSFEPIFLRTFLGSCDRAFRTGVRGAFVEGCTYGVATALIYLAEALLFYVGALMMAKGRYGYLQLVEVLNLVVFTVSIASQMMAFTQSIAKSVQAAHDFNRILALSTDDTEEARGNARPANLLCTSASHKAQQPILKFSNVTFAYPTRPANPILKNVSFNIKRGECIAIVGASGSGKSTIAALVQRLYRPENGRITVSAQEGATVPQAQIGVGELDVEYWRSHLSVVQQNPQLFNGTIAENIAYGSTGSEGAATVPPTHAQIRAAAKRANIHEFIMSLENGYDTRVGEKAELISGGQAQRLAIARALVRWEAGRGDGSSSGEKNGLLILDECTSALDGANQRAVMDTVRALLSPESEPGSESGSAVRNLSTLMITHNVDMMKLCDRILVLKDGAIVEEGSFEELIERRKGSGVFAELASGGEWQA